MFEDAFCPGDQYLTKSEVDFLTAFQGKLSIPPGNVTKALIMAAHDELGVDETGGAPVDGGPGLIYMPYVLMENLLDKLKLLNYDEVSSIIQYYISFRIIYHSFRNL